MEKYINFVDGPDEQFVITEFIPEGDEKFYGLSPSITLYLSMLGVEKRLIQVRTVGSQLIIRNNSNKQWTFEDEINSFSTPCGEWRFNTYNLEVIYVKLDLGILTVKLNILESSRAVTYEIS